MRLCKVRLRNFRCYKKETAFDIDALTVFVGKNDVGKSTIFDALNIFFEEGKLDSDDVSINGDKKDVHIICEFDDFPEELILDVDYPTSLEKEYMLNGDGRLEIHRSYDGSLATPKIKNTFAVAMHPTAKGYDDLLLLKNKELKDRAKANGSELEGIDLKINSQLRQAIWKAAPDLNFQLVEIPLDTETAKKVWDQLKKYMPSYALFKSDRQSTDQDVEAQDPMKAAIKEALKAQEADLEVIEEKVKEQVKLLAEKTVSKLQEMSPELARQLTPRFSKPTWSSVFKVTLTGDEEVPINKRGSGIRRLILLNFFRAKAEQAAVEKGAPNVIYAVEEPETSQHPNNQKMLMKAFHELSANPECQVLLTTHNPTLARTVPLECLRYICYGDNECRDIFCGSDEVWDLIAKDLGVLPDHDVKLFIGVEGINDINFLKGISKVLNEYGKPVPDLAALEDSGQVIFIPCGGSNLALWVSRFAKLNKPEFHLFDRDVKPPGVSKYQAAVDSINNRPGCKGFLTKKLEMENYLHPDAISKVRPQVRVSYGDFDDVPALVAKAIHESSASEIAWEDVSEKKLNEKFRKAKLWLNSEATLAMTPDMLADRDPDGEVLDWFNNISSLISSVV